MVRWFRRLADIPDVGYEGSNSIVRERLPGHDAVPERSVYTFDGKPHESLSWPLISENGTTSASPAQQHGVTEANTTQDLLHNLDEVLELPGEAADYHFAIQGVIEQLWNERIEEPAVLSHILP